MTTVIGLVPSERGVAALHLGAMLARSTSDDVVVASVVPTPWPPNPYRPDTEYLAYQETASRTALDQARDQIGPDLPVEYVLHRARSVASGLIEVAHEHHATLVTLGSSSAGAMGRVALGGIADRILHGCEVPLALAPRGWSSAWASERVKRVTVAFGRADTDGGLLTTAASVAEEIGVTLRVACFAVRPIAALGGSIELSAEGLVVDEWVKDLGRGIVSAMDSAGLGPIATRVETVVGRGSSWGEALADVSWVNGDLLVVGASDSPVSRFLLGSHASKIVRSSAVPVLLVPRSATTQVAGQAQA